MGYAGLPYDSLSVSSVGATIMSFGSEQQKRAWLPKIQTGEMTFAIGYTEPNTGTDLASIQIRAVRACDDYVINGQKIYTTSAHVSTHVWLAARTDPEAPKHRGISMFVVPLTTPGISVRPALSDGRGGAHQRDVLGGRAGSRRGDGGRGAPRLVHDAEHAGPGAGRDFARGAAAAKVR